MAIPESQLEIWSHQGAVAQSKDTYATVKLALEAPNTKYGGKLFAVSLQGSYGNDTNIYAESDVDVVIRLDSIYYFDTMALTAQELAAFNARFSSGAYPYTDYKAHVVAALQSSFGVGAVKSGTKAVKVRANGNRRSADVVVAVEFRRYYSAGLTGGILGPQYERGICFFTPSGDRIVNYPKQHSANCTAKHQATNGWFKPTVRILKNMRSKLVADGVIENGSAPSYFIEGLLYNVPDDKFGKSYAETFVAAINWILQAQQNNFVCANKRHYLVRDSIATCWPCSNCAGFLNALVDFWNGWR
jgi:hypothetical protein